MGGMDSPPPALCTCVPTHTHTHKHSEMGMEIHILNDTLNAYHTITKPSIQYSTSTCTSHVGRKCNTLYIQCIVQISIAFVEAPACRFYMY